MVVERKKGPPSRRSAIRKTAEEVDAFHEKNVGRELFINGSELKDRVIKRVTTGSLAFDIELGGGWPLNMWNEVIGTESSGKTSSIYATIAANQKLHPKWSVLWIASEPFVAQWAEVAGCDLSRFKLVETNVMEEAYAIIIDYLDNRLCDCIVIDSLPALVPKDEDDNTFDEWQMGLSARLNGKFFRKQAPASRRSLIEDDDRDCLLLAVNQWRDKIGVMFGDPRTTPGGKGKNYWYATRVETARDEWIKEDDVRVGIRIRTHTIKNKTAPPERQAGVDFYFARNEARIPPGNYDTGKDLYSSAVYFGIIEKAERGGAHTYGEHVWRSQAACIQSIREDLDMQALLRYEVLRSQGIDVDPPTRHTAPARKAATARKTPARTKTPAKAPAATQGSKKSWTKK